MKREIDTKINAELITNYLKQNNLSKTEFCKRCKISLSTFYRLFTKQDVKLLSLFKLCREMNLPIKDLFLE